MLSLCDLLCACWSLVCSAECVCVWSVNVCVLLAARCQLDVDFGFQCTDFVQRWFFDRTVAACSPFWFGGCGGNANRFSSEHECFRTCGVQSKSSLTVTGPLSSISASVFLCNAVSEGTGFSKEPFVTEETIHSNILVAKYLFIQIKCLAGPS